MMAQSTKGSLGDMPAAFMNLLSAQMKLTSELFESLYGQPMPSLKDLGKSAEKMFGKSTGCGPATGTCSIPAPCWMPRSLGECVSHVAECKTACVRFVVTNCDRVSRTISARVAGGGMDQITLAPTSLTLGPQE